MVKKEPLISEIESVEKDGKARVHVRAEVPSGMRLRVTIETAEADDFSLESQTIITAPTQISTESSPLRKKIAPFLLLREKYQQSRPGKLLSKSIGHLGWEGALLGLALMVYLLTRLVGLADYPIYFFTDEAVQTVLASDLVRDHYHSPDEEWMPTYFYNAYQYNLGFSVYLQVVPFLLFGKSVVVTRGISVLVTVLGALCTGLILRKVFRLPYAFTSVLLLSITPAWFLHSRTAFETSLATAFFACFIYFYLMYRSASPRYLYGAVVCAALMFYSYSPARVVIGLTAVLLLLTDIPYHIRHWRTVLLGLLLTVILALPFVRFQLGHPDANFDHLRVLDSYWIQSISLLEKLKHFFIEYLKGLNPGYWYLPNNQDLSRHLMKGYGHVLWFTFPFTLLGLGIAIRNIRQSIYRTLIIALIAAPSGAALVALGITRALSMVIPLALLGGVGLSFTLQWAGKRWMNLKNYPAIITLVLLVGVNFWMLRDALVNGPLWYQDYGLGGMQYGARQVYAELAKDTQAFPNTKYILSPSWANGADIVARFFFPDPLPFQLGSIQGYMNEKRTLDDSLVFIMIPDEYQAVMQSNKFTDIRVGKTLLYPNEQPGFYFVQLRYVDNIDQVLEAESAERRILREAQVEVHGSPATVKYSYLDMGTIENIFDGNLQTLIRTMEANPLVIEINFNEPLTIQYVGLQVGGTPSEVTIQMSEAGTASHLEYIQQVDANPDPRLVEFQLKEPVNVSSLRLVVKSVNDGEPAHVHLWEVLLQP
jgi:hypothetical protein